MAIEVYLKRAKIEFDALPVTKLRVLSLLSFIYRKCNWRELYLEQSCGNSTYILFFILFFFLYSTQEIAVVKTIFLSAFYETFAPGPRLQNIILKNTVFFSCVLINRPILTDP